MSKDSPVMNEPWIDGKWNEIKGKVKEQWGKLTDDDLDQIEGNRDKLAGMVQERYGKTREAAEKEVDDWFDSL